ncbi:MAG: aminoacyl-tRNA hydrolase, partial [Clostridia bacterium]|nr:aminoacyl-tRNA hydrolase [Clostridia bacterium]
MIIYDDISLDVGRMRIRAKGSAGGHNGLKSIISHLGTDVFARIKMGVGGKPEGWDLADHVLGRFSDEENKVMRDMLEKASA